MTSQHVIRFLTQFLTWLLPIPAIEHAIERILCLALCQFRLVYVPNPVFDYHVSCKLYSTFLMSVGNIISLVSMYKSYIFFGTALRTRMWLNRSENGKKYQFIISKEKSVILFPTGKNRIEFNRKSFTGKRLGKRL